MNIFYKFKPLLRSLFSEIMVRVHYGNTRYKSTLKEYYDFASIKNIINKRFKKQIQQSVTYCEQVRKSGEKPKNQYYLCTSLIIKDEASYIEEWLEYYLLIGVEHFYIYDNGSNDDLKQRLKYYEEKSLVTYINFSGDARQEEMCMDCLARFGHTTRWMMLIDSDEFMLCNQGSLVDLLKRYEHEYSQISLRWFLFGSSKHETRPEGLLTENFLYRSATFSNLHDGMKSIFQPHLTIASWLHRSFVIGNTLILTESEGQCNHYYCKSWEEFCNKNTRGDATKQQNKPKFESITIARQFFDMNDLNEVLDERILPIAHQIKQRLKERP